MAQAPLGGDEFRLRKGLVLMTVGIGQLMIILDLTIINVALENIRVALLIENQADLQWTVTAYTVTFGGLLLLGGKFADRFGRRRIFVSGALIFAFASLFGGLSTSLGMLISARVLQGVGAAMMSPAALAIIAVVFAEGKERDRALGVWAAISAGGAAIGLLLGGILTEYASWRWVLFVNVPIALFAVYAALRFVPESRDENTRSFDVIGAAFATSGLMLLVYGLVTGDRYDWGPQPILTIVVAVALIAAFAYRVRTAQSPLVPRVLLRNRNLMGAIITGFFLASGLFAVFFFLVLWVRQLQGWSPIDAGLGFLPVAIFIIVGAVIASATIGRTGPRRIGTIGPLIGAAGLLFVGVGLSPDSTYAGVILPGLMLMGVGMGMAFVALTTSALAKIPPEHTGVASALLNDSQQVGGAVGLGILIALADFRTSSLVPEGPPPIGPGGLPLDVAASAAYAPALVQGWSLALIAAAGFLAAAALAMSLLVRLKPGEFKPPGFRN